MNYRLAYAVGFHPWEDLAEHPPFRDKLLELVAHEEDGREPPYGGSLDIGTGSAVWGIRLAERGWDVTGIDVVEKALRRSPASRGGGRRDAPRASQRDELARSGRRRGLSAAARHRHLSRSR